MGFLNKLLRKAPPMDNAETSPPVQGAQPETPAEWMDTPDISGADAGKRISELLTRAKLEGWHPVASLQLVCNQCHYPIPLDYEYPTAGEEVVFQVGDAFQNITSPLICPQCGNDRFRIINRRIEFRDWLRTSLNDLSPCDDDLDQGFRTSERGELIRDHQFKAAQTFEELWNAVSAHLDTQGVLKRNFTFNYLDIPSVGARHIARTAAVLHQNNQTRELVVVIKDRQHRFWYRIESE